MWGGTRARIQSPRRIVTSRWYHRARACMFDFAFGVKAFLAAITNLHLVGLDCDFTFQANNVISVGRTWPVVEVRIVAVITEGIVASPTPNVCIGVELHGALAAHCIVFWFLR